MNSEQLSNLVVEALEELIAEGFIFGQVTGLGRDFPPAPHRRLELLERDELASLPPHKADKAPVLL